ncbi:hypothetical protein V6N13_048097 [Hibiscus sabdariffa]
MFKEPKSPRVKNFSRVDTNVEDDQSIYQDVVGNSTWLRVFVEPSTLTFTEKNQKQSFVVSVEIDGNAPAVLVISSGLINIIAPSQVL